MPLLQMISYFQSFAVFCITGQNIVKESEKLHVSRTVWGCFKHSWESVIDWNVVK